MAGIITQVPIVAIFATVIAIDAFVAWVLTLIAEKSEQEITQKGMVHFGLNVTGRGLVAKMLRRLSTAVEINTTLDTTLSNKACLPKVYHTPHFYLTNIYGYFTWVFIMCFVHAFLLRAKPWICSMWYPRQEEKRVVFLYNTMLRERRRLLRSMAANVRKKARDHSLRAETGIFLLLRDQLPEFFGWFKKLGLGRRHCLVCGDAAKRPKTYLIKCPTAGCKYTYCEMCWFFVVKERCYPCEAMVRKYTHSDYETSDDEMKPKYDSDN